MEAALSNATSIAGPVSSMNRLQRSLSAGRIPSLAKDSTAKVAQFLNQCIKSIKSWIVERIASRDKPMVSKYTQLRGSWLIASSMLAPL